MVHLELKLRTLQPPDSWVPKEQNSCEAIFYNLICAQRFRWRFLFLAISWQLHFRVTVQALFLKHCEQKRRRILWKCRFRVNFGGVLLKKSRFCCKNVETHHEVLRIPKPCIETFCVRYDLLPYELFSLPEDPDGNPDLSKHAETHLIWIKK